MVDGDTAMLMTRCNGESRRQQNRTIWFVVIGCLTLAACGSLPSIATETNYCCAPLAEKIHSYRVEFEDMPEFLKPMLRDEVSIVLASKGLDYTEGDADAVLTMTYIDTPLSTDRTGEDEAFGSPPAGGARFIAEVRVKMENSVTRELISSGSLSRTHNVTIGTYMHETPARGAMRKAFVELFSDYPNRILDDI